MIPEMKYTFEPGESDLFYDLKTQQALHEVTIRFDGGTPCNIPSLGYGIGYGSYQLNSLPIVRVDHGRRMSANAAEIFTLIRAVQDTVKVFGRTGVGLTITGDSRIAIKWANGRTFTGKPAKFSKGGSEEFRNAVKTLRDVLTGFARVDAIWQPRIESVKLFGH